MESGMSRSAYGFFTFHLPRPASGPAPFHLSSGPALRVLLGIGGRLRVSLNSKKAATRLITNIKEIEQSSAV